MSRIAAPPPGASFTVRESVAFTVLFEIPSFVGVSRDCAVSA